MRDYPWTEKISTEQWNYDIPLELSIWGTISLVFVLGSKMSFLALYPEFDNPAGFPMSFLGSNEQNLDGIYHVDLSIYTAASFFNLFSAVLDLVTTAFGLSFYCIRIQQYDDILLAKYSPAFFWDFSAIIIFSFGLLTIFYRIFIYSVYIEEFLPFGFLVVK